MDRQERAIDWPPRSPDLTVCDYWLWGYLREEVFKSDRPKTLLELATKLTNAFNAIDHQMVKRVYENFVKRCELCVQHNGNQFEQFL